MRVGRPPMKSALVEGLEGAAREKQRLRAMLDTLSGEVTLESAYGELGLSRSQFCELRTRALQAALDGLMLGVPGRKPKVREVDASEVVRLEREVAYLREELAITRVRAEVALVMPRSLRARQPAGKCSARAGESSRRSGMRRSATTSG